MSIPPQPGDTNNRTAWRPWWRWLISGLLAFHVTAVFMGPFAFSTRTPSETSSALAEWIMPVFRPYVQAAYLDHGYAFFAPDPGPSHLIKYKVDFEDGRASVEGTFPNLKEERPRLLYHRHFMLSEQLHSSFAPATFENSPLPAPRRLDEREQGEWKDYVERQIADRKRNWERDRKAYDTRWASFERHLLHAHGGDSVSMARIEHQPPGPLLVQKLKFRLDDESLYRTLTKDDAGEPRPSAQDATGVPR